MAKLELLSQYHDQSIDHYRYVVHWTNNATETVSVLDSGLEFIEGQPEFSTSLVHPLGAGFRENGERGRLLVCAVPVNYHLGYGVFTTAYVDRRDRTVTGSALGYAEGRKRLTMYAAQDTEAERRKIEAEVQGGYEIGQHPRVKLDRPFILAQIDPSMEFERVVAKIDATVRAFERVDQERMAQALLGFVQPVNMNATDLLPEALAQLVRGTVEAIVISRLRIMRWQGLSLQGYNFFENGKQIQIAPVKDAVEHQRRIDEFETQAETAHLFLAEVAWLREYVVHELAVMKVEIKGAELDSTDG